jgi:hypothetical protein
MSPATQKTDPESLYSFRSAWDIRLTVQQLKDMDCINAPFDWPPRSREPSGVYATELADLTFQIV